MHKRGKDWLVLEKHNEEKSYPMSSHEQWLFLPEAQKGFNGEKNQQIPDTGSSCLELLIKHVTPI